MKYGGPGAIPPCKVECRMDDFENHIRRIGVVAVCEWFGYDEDAEFTHETIRVLCERSGIEAQTDP